MPDLLPILEACEPRPPDQTSQHYAADLHRALSREIGAETDAADFFAATYATAAMRRVAAGVFDRLQRGGDSDAPAVIRFNSAFGGGKTHTLIALAAAAKHPRLVAAGETGGLLPPDLAADDVRLVCFTGENANLLDGMPMDGSDRRAKSLTGYLAYHLGGDAAFDALKRHDDLFSDPGAEGFQELIGDRPALILLDELVRWAAAANQIEGDSLRRAGNGLRNALTAIAKAVSNSSRAVLVVTTPEGGHDAYQQETQQVSQQLQAIMREVNSVTARTARDYTPTESGDFPAILRRRLFANAEDSEQRGAVADAYAAVWRRENTTDADARQRFYDCYPFHPETLRVIRERLASNNDFQRVRGTLRALSAVIHHGPAIAEPLVHPYHLDVSVPAVREELVNRTGHQALDAAIEADVIGENATSKRFGDAARRAANIILLGSLAPTANTGLADAEIVNGVISPAAPDASVARQAVQNMKDNGLYISDDPDAATTRFNRQANVRREVESRAAAVSENDREDGLWQAILEAFSDSDMGVTIFPSRANNVPDDPDLVHIGIVNPSHFTQNGPDRDAQLGALYRHNNGNGGGALREHRNNALFLVPDHDCLADAKQLIARHKAASEMLDIDNQAPKLLEYQRGVLDGIKQSSRKAAYQSIQRNWIYLHYPDSRQPNGLTSSTMNFPDREGQGQTTVVNHLTGETVGNMVHPRSPGLSPDVWAKAGLRQAGADGMTVGELHARFTRTPDRAMFLKRADFDKALDRANEEGDGKIVVIRNPYDLEQRSGSGVPYRDDMRVWLKEHAPPLAPLPDPEPAAPPAPDALPTSVRDGGAAYILPFTTPDALSGQVAVAELRTHMNSGGLDWDGVASAELRGTEIGMLNDMASKAQSNGVDVRIRYAFDFNGFDLLVDGKSAEEWQQCRRACQQMQRAAGADAVDARIAIENADDAVRKMIHDLDNAHQITLRVNFRQADAQPQP